VTETISPAANKIITVRMNVAKSELTFSIPIFAKMAVSATNPSDRVEPRIPKTASDFHETALTSRSAAIRAPTDTATDATI
jgi:hypothetical protein